jgi:hypothetical protein
MRLQCDCELDVDAVDRLFDILVLKFPQYTLTMHLQPDGELHLEHADSALAAHLGHTPGSCLR